jgi:hypothetical protein
MVMLRIFFAIVVLLHGLIHLMGFIKAFRLAGIRALSLDISRPAGVLWLTAAVLFTVTAVLLLMNREWWWMAAAAAIVLSQALIALYWHDAKFGTIANILVLCGAVLGYGAWSFNAGSRAALALFAAPAAPERSILTRESIAGLPPVVRKWLERSNAVGREIARSVSLKQRGMMRTAPDGKRMPVTADQRIITGRPAFLWLAEVRAAPGIYLAARDTYREGKGRMYIRALSLVPVADARGKEIDQGGLVRYLAEIVWAPSAAVHDYLRWEEAGPNAAKATMTWGGVTASGVFTFNTEGDMSGFRARRYYDRKGGSNLEEWVISIEPDGCREFEGVRIPSRFSVTWRLKEGDFTWYRMEITDIRYNE